MSAELPRSVLLASWGTAALTGGASADQARVAVEGDDEPHGVVVRGGAPVASCDGGDLAGLLSALRAAGVAGLRVVLPSPGDVLGLPGPAAVNAEALEAGECVLTVGGPPMALVPEVEGFGSRWEPGTHVTWHVLDCEPSTVTDVGSLGEAERELREALLSATAALDDLDVARWRPDAAVRLQSLRRGVVSEATLPAGTPPRAVRVVDLAWRVRGIVELAAEDDGGSVSGWEATRRAEALRGLDRTGRRALVAAANAALERGR